LREVAIVSIEAFRLILKCEGSGLLWLSIEVRGS
jgi:hypothetical protein